MCNHIMRKWVTVIDGYYRHGHVQTSGLDEVWRSSWKNAKNLQAQKKRVVKLLHDPIT